MNTWPNVPLYYMKHTYQHQLCCPTSCPVYVRHAQFYVNPSCMTKGWCTHLHFFTFFVFVSSSRFTRCFSSLDPSHLLSLVLLLTHLAVLFCIFGALTAEDCRIISMNESKCHHTPFNSWASLDLVFYIPLPCLMLKHILLILQQQQSKYIILDIQIYSLPTVGSCCWMLLFVPLPPSVMCVLPGYCKTAEREDVDPTLSSQRCSVSPSNWKQNNHLSCSNNHSWISLFHWFSYWINTCCITTKTTAVW